MNDLPAAVNLELPEAPSANRWWRMGRSGPNGGPRHMHLSAEARAYKQVVALKTGSALRPISGAREWPVYPGRIPLTIALHWFRSRRAGDLDKRIGIALDALQGTLFSSDSQIVEIVASRDEDPDGIGRLRVTVRPKHERHTKPYFPDHDDFERGLECVDCRTTLIDLSINRGQQIAPAWKIRRGAAPDPTLDDGEHGVAWIWEIVCATCAGQ